MKHAHLIAGLVSLLFLVGTLVVAEGYAHSLESAYIHALAPKDFLLKHQGSALQREAFQASDLLPFYGSSELEIHDPYHANTLFRKYPTGFTVFPVGVDATEMLNMLQKFAAVGDALRGKRVAISLSPQFFIEPQEPKKAYQANFSALQAYELAFSSNLDWSLKRDVAKRMLEYPGPTIRRTLLFWALNLCVDGSTWSEAIYGLLWPLGKLETLVINLQDDWQVVTYIWDDPGLRDPVREPGALDWPALQSTAARQARAAVTGNSFGIPDNLWVGLQAHVLSMKGQMNDRQFLRALDNSAGWRDLDLMLRTLKQLGARPLIICMPLDGVYYDWLGVSPQARSAFYAKLAAVVGAYGDPVVDFRDHEEDRYFLISPESHLSSEGWVFYDDALDNFYHGRLDSVRQ